MIRPARADEARLLGELAVRSKGHWGYDADFLARCRDELAVEREAIAAGDVFVLEEAGRVVGFCSLERLDAERVELGHLFVEPGAIGHGHGGALLRHARAVARERGFATLVIQGDPNAEPFYRAAGGRLVGRRPSESIPGRDLPLFEIAL